MGVVASLCNQRSSNVSPEGAENSEAKKKVDRLKPVNLAKKRRVAEEDLPATFEQLGYKLGPSLGCGNFGQVSELLKVAKNHEKPGRSYAVKILNCARAPRDLVKHFLPREMAALQWIDHPNIVPVHRIFYLGRHLCMLMQLMKFNLGEMLVEQGALSSHMARKVFSDVCAGLHYCHVRKLAHRDVKCQNILLDYNGTAKLSDFGFCRPCIDPNTHRRVISATFCGTVIFSAPEILAGIPYSPMPSDMWSLGVVLYIMVCGCIPFPSIEKEQIYELQEKEQWSFPPEKKSAISSTCCHLIERLLQPIVPRRATWCDVMSNRWLHPHPREEGQELEAVVSQRAALTRLQQMDFTGVKGVKNKKHLSIIKDAS